MKKHADEGSRGFHEEAAGNLLQRLRLSSCCNEQSSEIILQVFASLTDSDGGQSSSDVR